ncbi:MAG TPA: prepilin peptidase [Limosilactobacillus coleohominis]|nr:prepilin peptidase [Limosilactobacillus coleohominis]
MIIILLLFGTCWSSFLTTWTWRNIFNLNSALGSHSVCDHCQNKISWYHLIPLIGYLLQLGKCHYCGKRINCYWFMCEVVGAFFWAEFPIFSIQDLIIFLIVDSCMIITCTQDWFTHEFNGYLILSIWLLHYLNVINPSHITVLLYALFWMIGYFYSQIGNGDIDFIIMTTLSCGPYISTQAVLFACFLSILHPKLYRHAPIPLLPFLWLGLFLSLIIKKHVLL